MVDKLKVKFKSRKLKVHDARHVLGFTFLTAISKLSIPGEGGQKNLLEECTGNRGRHHGC
jgi:hypothetical protein